MEDLAKLDKRRKCQHKKEELKKTSQITVLPLRLYTFMHDNVSAIKCVLRNKINCLTFMCLLSLSIISLFESGMWTRKHSEHLKWDTNGLQGYQQTSTQLV